MTTSTNTSSSTPPPSSSSSSSPLQSHEVYRIQKKEKPKTLVKYLVSCFFLVVAMHTFHFIIQGDPLSSPYVNGPYVSIDSWSFIHLFYFAVLGYHFPDQKIAFFIYGAIWEGFEWLMSNHTRSFWEEDKVNMFWDLWFNFIGYSMGELIRLKRDLKLLHQAEDRKPTAVPKGGKKKTKSK